MNSHPTVQDYAHILEELRRAVPGPVHIAGGAVRDTILGRPIRDVDIFLGNAHGDAATARLRSLGYVKVGQWVQYEGFSDPMVSGVAKFERADETIPLCLIGLKQDLTAKANIARFDFGVCMAAFTGDALTTDDAFKRDAEGKTFTLLPADNLQQFTYSMVRFEKLSADRYEGWTLSVPSHFEALAREHTFRQHWYEEGIAHFGVEDEHTQVLRPKAR